MPATRSRSFAQFANRTGERTTPFRGEKNTNWEGSYRVPALVRWPGLVKPHTEINDIVSAEDWVQTLVSAAGEPDVQN
jgi:arylsulfatase A-like enzyme